MMGNKETVAIAWCHAGEVDAMFAHSILDLVRLYPNRIQSCESVLGLGLLSKSRNILVKNFLDNSKNDWLFMVDADEYITPDAFNKLVNLADRRTAPAISGLYFAANFSEDQELQPVPLIFVNDPELGIQPYFDYPHNKVVEIYAAGTGCLMIHRSVLERLRELGEEAYGRDWAWFMDGPIGGNKWLSEDLVFCDRINQAGFKMFAHTGAVLPHHKSIWLVEKNYKDWVSKNNTDDIKPMQ